MAEVEHSTPTRIGAETWRATWLNVTEADTYEALAFSALPDAVMVAVSDTIGGATVTLTGSIDGTNYFNLTRINGLSASTTANGLFEVAERVLYIKPSHSGGSSQQTDITVVYKL